MSKGDTDTFVFSTAAEWHLLNVANIKQTPELVESKADLQLMGLDGVSPTMRGSEQYGVQEKAGG